MDACEKHPQRQQIIDAILAGEALRDIARRISPPLGHATIGRFRLKVLKTAVSPLRPNKKEPHVIRTIAAQARITKRPDIDETAFQQTMRQEIQSSAGKLEERLERWISDAEQRAVIGADGMPVRDSDGTVVRALEHKALAAHTRNALTSLEFRAKLAGLLHEGATINNVQFVIMRQSAPIESEHSGQVIDIEETR